QATPWGDNAQAELIRNGETGFIVEDYQGLRRAVAELAADGERDSRMAEEAGRDMSRRFGVAPTWALLNAFIDHAAAGGRGLITLPAGIARDQRARLTAGIACYAKGNPLCRRIQAERPLYLRPWFWRLSAQDGAAIVKRRLG